MTAITAPWLKDTKMPDIQTLDGKTCKLILFDENQVINDVESAVTYDGCMWGIKKTNATSTSFRYIAFPIKSMIETPSRQKNIADICDRLERVWKQHPELRLGQLMTILSKTSDIFYITDEKIMEALTPKAIV